MFAFNTLPRSIINVEYPVTGFFFFSFILFNLGRIIFVNIVFLIFKDNFIKLLFVIIIGTFEGKTLPNLDLIANLNYSTIVKLSI